MRKTDKRTRRGAALIIAIAILTVMLAIGLTFFTVARVESTTAMNVVNTVRAEHLVDAGFAMAEYRLNRDLWDHPQATSLDHGWHTMFNGAAFAGKNWANSTGNPAFNLEPFEQKLRDNSINAPVSFANSLLYVKYVEDGYMEPLFRGPRTAPWLSIPRWQGNAILLYKSQTEMPLCNANGETVPDDTVNNLANGTYAIVRYDDSKAALYPFVTSSVYGIVTARDSAGELSYPFGTDALWPAEQIDRWADVDTNGDGMRDAIWVPLPKDVDLSADGVDNDLDGRPDNPQADETGQMTLDEDGNPRNDFEIGAFVYRAAINLVNPLLPGRVIRKLPDPDAPGKLWLTVPLPGLRLPVDMNNDGRIDTQDYYNNNKKNDPAGSPVYVTLPSQVNVFDSTAPGGVKTLDISAVDALDNDYDQFVNGFNAYVFLGDPNNTGHAVTAADGDAQIAAQRIAGVPVQNQVQYDATNARTKYANKVIKWPTIMQGVTLSANAPAWLADAAVPPVVITLTGEPVCDIIGRAAIQVVDESSKVNMNAAGGHIYRDDLDITGDPTAGQHVQRALNQGASTFEYETRALPATGHIEADYLWGMITGAGWMTQSDGTKWDYRSLSVDAGRDIPTAIPYAPLRPYAYDISLPGYGRVDDNMNALLLAFNGRADSGNAHPDQGLWVPPLGPFAGTVLDGNTLTGTAGVLANAELSGQIPGKVPYAEVGDAVRKPSFKAYYGLLGMLEGIDDPSELQLAAPLRNQFAESDKADNNNDGVTDEIGETGDRLLANNYELQKAVNAGNQKLYGDLTWPYIKNVVTANSDSRNVNYIESATGPKAVNKIDPNLAPPAQLAAGLLIKGDIVPVTALGRNSSQTAKISLPSASDPANLDPLRFAEGLRQADTTFTGYLFGQSNDRFDADPELQAMQTAVNIADSRDADCVRSLLVMDKQITAPYLDAIPRLYGVPLPFALNAPAEPLNERERVPQSDAFPVGDLQDFLNNALGGVSAGKRVIAVDRWWENLTAAVSSDATVADREDRTISYAVAGTDAIRINEMMVRPVRRVEAEAVTHLHYNTTTNAIDPTAPRMTLSDVAANGGASIAAQYVNLNPTPIVGMPAFDIEAIPPVFDDSATSAWNVQSYYDYTNIPATPNRVILGDETAYRYVVANNPGWTVGGDNTPANINNDIIEFRIKATDGLPPGRYYLTVNVVDPVTGKMTVDGADPVTGVLNEELQYSVKYMSSVAGGAGISDDIRFISSAIINVWDKNPPQQPISLVAEKQQLLFDYFEKYWLTVDKPEYIASEGRLKNGSGAPVGWVFTPINAIDLNTTPPLLASAYPNISDYVNNVLGINFTQGLSGYHTSYLRDDILPPVLPSPYGLDHPSAGRTFTVIVPPNDPTAPYDTLCIAFRLKPTAENILGMDGNPRRLAINFLDFSQQPDHEYVELANTTDKAIQLDGWTLEVGIPDPAGIAEDPTMRDPFKSRWTIPLNSNTVIAPKGYLLLGFDKFDKFQTGGANNLIEANGMGLAAGSALAGLNYVTEPPIAGVTTSAAYAPFSDATASVFRRNDLSDYIDNDGDGLSSANLVYGNGVLQNLDLDTDNVATEAKYHGQADGTVPPFARIVKLECQELWWESPTGGTPYAPDAKPVNWVDLTTTQRIAELVLRGGILPDYPEHDGHDNDGDGGYVTRDAAAVDGAGNPLLRYVRGTLDKDMVDNNLDGRIDENGKEVFATATSSYLFSGRPLLSEGVDEGRFQVDAGLYPNALVFQHLAGIRPRTYGYGAFEEGDSPIFMVCNVVPYRDWVSKLETISSLLPVQASDGYPYLNTTYLVTPVSGGMPVVAATSAPEWKAFCERRWNPGDNVIVTLYVGPASDRKVADRATYREQDVINRAVDDIQPSPYAVDGYRNFMANAGFFYTDPNTGVKTPTPPLALGDSSPYPVADCVCLDRNRQQYWLPNQMGLDFYRSLERKHPLYPGDKFGIANRWDPTDGSYDDWSDSLGLFEAEENRSGDSSKGRAMYLQPRFGGIVPGSQRLFGHAISGSPLRMNTQQRIWDDPPDLLAYLVNKGSILTMGDTEGLTSTIPLDGGRRRQFAESDSVTIGQGTSQLSFEDRAYSLRRADVRNQPFNSVGDLMKLPMLAFNVPLNTGLTEAVDGNPYTYRSTNAVINTRWLPAAASPAPTNPLWYWRQDTTLDRAVLATAPDNSGTGSGFAGVTTLTDINPVTLTVGQARFRPIWPNNPDDPATPNFNPAVHLAWQATGTAPNFAVRAPHCWSPVMLFASDRTTLPYPPPLPVGNVLPNKTVAWDAPAAWYRWNNVAPVIPYLVQEQFLFDTHHTSPVFGALQQADVDARWPMLRRFPPLQTQLLENAEYPRAVMYVSQHDELLGENGRAEGLFSWDVNDGLENGTYIAYVATFVPRMGPGLADADLRVMQRTVAGGTVNGMPAFDTTIMPQQSGAASVAVASRDPFAAKICSLDPTLPHADGEDRFEPVLALEFITDPGVADRVAPPPGAGYTPDPARPLAALPHPKNWFATTTVNGVVQSGAAAYHADGDGMILYSGSGQVTWKARLVRVTDNYLALRVRNLGLSNQVACITGVVLAPARHVAGKINVNTAENERVLSAVNTNAKTYSFSIFNTLLGLPGVINALATVRDPAPTQPDEEVSMGGTINAETDFGWPTRNTPMKGTTGDVRRERWMSPADLTGVDLPPAGARTAEFPNNLLAQKNTGNDWSADFDGVGALRLSSMIMAARPEHYDGRYYENFGELIAGYGKGGTLKLVYPLSNENQPEWRADEIDRRFGHMVNLITTRSDVFEILVTVQAGNAVDANGDNHIDYRGTDEFSVMAESQGRVIYERRARTDRSDEAAQ